MSANNIVTIGSTLIDIFIESDEFAVEKSADGAMLCQLLGDKIEVDRFTMLSGGGASNTAVGFARQGFQAIVMSELGTDVLATQAINELKAEEVETRYLTQEKREETGLSVILVAPNGSRTVLVHRAAASMLEVHDVKWEVVQQAKWVHCSSVSGQVELLKKLFALARESNFKLSWNPGKREIESLVIGHLSPEELVVEILFVNEQEWEALSQVQAQLLEKIPQIVVTSGRDGGVVFQSGQEYARYEIEKVKTVEETGAGDAFIVGYLSEQIRGKSIEDSFELGRKNAASVVQQVGSKAGLLKIS